MSVYTLYVHKWDGPLHYYLSDYRGVYTHVFLNPKSLEDTKEFLKKVSCNYNSGCIDTEYLEKITDFTDWNDLITNYPELLL